MSDKRVLVVDDEESVIYTCVEELQQEGFEARGVTNGAEAIELYKVEGFDLVLVDLKMPDVDGIEVMRAIVEYDPEARVVIMTAYGTVDTAVEALRSGAREFVTKPFDVQQLVDKLRTVLEQRSDKAVRGNLRDLGLASIISVNCNEHNQAELLIRRQGRLAAMYFENGTIVHASLDDQEGEGVIYELLAWEDGSFSLTQGIAPPKRTVETDWTGLLLEGMRRLDEESADLESLLDVTQATQDENLDRVARALNVMDGIDGVVICSAGGELLGQATSVDPLRQATLTALLGHRAESLGIALNAARPKQLLLMAEKRGTIIIPYQQNYVGISLTERASAESMVTEIQTILRRYQ